MVKKKSKIAGCYGNQANKENFKKKGETTAKEWQEVFGFGNKGVREEVRLQGIKKKEAGCFAHFFFLKKKSQDKEYKK